MYLFFVLFIEGQSSLCEHMILRWFLLKEKQDGVNALSKECAFMNYMSCKASDSGEQRKGETSMFKGCLK